MNSNPWGEEENQRNKRTISEDNVQAIKTQETLSSLAHKVEIVPKILEKKNTPREP